VAEVKWTEEQLQAITLRDNNILVAAGAGSGKTTVLIERIIRRLTDTKNPVDVDKLLVVTYTNAAAAEMKHRLAVALHKAIALNPQNRHLVRQLSLLQRAHINTLHAFCLDVVRRYYYLLDLDPETKVGNDTDLFILREKVLDEVFEESYGEENSALRLLLQKYGRGLNDLIIKDMILRITDAANSMPEPNLWLEQLLQPYDEGNLDIWVDYLLYEVKDDVKNCLQDYEYMIKLCSDEFYGLERCLDLLNYEKKSLAAMLKFSEEDLPKEVLWDNYKTAFNGVNFGRFPTIKSGDCDVDIKTKVQNIRKKCKETVKNLTENYFWQSYNDLQKNILSLKPVAEALLELCRRYIEAWQKAKKEKCYFEFSDLEHYCLEILKNQDVSEQLKRDFAEVFVDEYQDINRVQEAILNSVSRDSNRFMVGDIKQSIYRFRMAEPALFNDKYYRYAVNDGGCRIDLMDNFRSQSNIINGVNYIFKQLMVGNQLEIIYDDDAKLKAGNKDFEPCPLELILLDKESTKNSFNVLLADEVTSVNINEDMAGQSSDPVEEMLKWEKEAVVIAERIQDEVAAGRNYQDFCILLRTVKNVAIVIKDTLQKFGIPCITEGQSDFFDTPETEIAVSLLKIIDNPLQDIEMATVLHSPIVGLSLSELAELRILAPDQYLYEAMKLSEDVRIKDFLKQLQYFRNPMSVLGIKDFCKEIFNKMGLVSVMTAQNGGDVRKDNLAEFLNVASDYDESSHGGLYGFIRYLEWLKTKGKGSRKQVNSQNAVTVMSIHRSKGLEFPVVFIADIDKKFNKTDLRNDILLHREMGLGLKYVDLENRVKYKTLGFSAIAMKMDWEIKAEELRVLYVAMTRAKEKLFLVGMARNEESIINKALQAVNFRKWQLPNGIIKECNSYMDWLIFALARHKDFQYLLSDEIKDIPREIFDGECHWLIDIRKKLPDLIVTEQQTNCQNYNEVIDNILGNVVIDNNVKESLSWHYKYENMSKMPIKWSATAINNRKESENIKLEKAIVNLADIDEDNGDYLPKHNQEWYADLGTCVHYLLEKVDLAKVAAGENIDNLFNDILEKYQASEDVKKSVNTKKIAKFFDSLVGKKLLWAQKKQKTILREADFTLAISVKELAEVFFNKENINDDEIQQFALYCGVDYQKNSSEKIFFQGVIDLCFETDNGWIIVDYKSGGSRGLTDDEIIRKYGSQLMLYKKALEKITLCNVCEQYIYYTGAARIVKC
jgi:ATP-dependent helicase/nuclease subunit A